MWIKIESARIGRSLSQPVRNLPGLSPTVPPISRGSLESLTRNPSPRPLQAGSTEQVLYRLCSEPTDVFITNFPPAVRGRLGDVCRACSAQMSGLIYAPSPATGARRRKATSPGFRHAVPIGHARPDGSGAARMRTRRRRARSPAWAPTLCDGAVRRLVVTRSTNAIATCKVRM